MSGTESSGNVPPQTLADLTLDDFKTVLSQEFAAMSNAVKNDANAYTEEQIKPIRTDIEIIKEDLKNSNDKRDADRVDLEDLRTRIDETHQKVTEALDLMKINLGQPVDQEQVKQIIVGAFDNDLANTVVLTSAPVTNGTSAYSFPSHLFLPISGILDHAPHSVRGF